MTAPPQHPTHLRLVENPEPVEARTIHPNEVDALVRRLSIWIHNRRAL